MNWNFGRWLIFDDGVWILYRSWMMWSGLMIKGPKFCYFDLTFKEERICFEWIQLFKIWMVLNWVDKSKNLNNWWIKIGLKTIRRSKFTNWSESIKGENRIKENKAPWSIISKIINELILAQPAYNTVYSIMLLWLMMDFFE